MEGWIRLHRSITEHWLWSKFPFSEGQAWIDLLMLANWEDKKTPYKGEIITCKRGDVNLSVSALADRWKWSRKKTTKFLKLLENDKMVTTNISKHRTTITIVNYGLFQDVGTTNGTTDYTTRVTTEEQPRNITNKEKKDKNIELTKVNSCKSETKTSCQEVVDLFHKTCPSLPSVRTISEGRKKSINARLKEHSLEEIKEAFAKAEASNFLKGSNERNWSADFDWIMNSNNMAKILDGKYDNNKRQGNGINGNSNRHTKAEGNNESIGAAEDFIQNIITNYRA